MCTVNYETINQPMGFINNSNIKIAVGAFIILTLSWDFGNQKISEANHILLYIIILMSSSLQNTKLNSLDIILGLFLYYKTSEVFLYKYTKNGFSCLCLLYN